MKVLCFYAHLHDATSALIRGVSQLITTLEGYLGEK